MYNYVQRVFVGKASLAATTLAVAGTAQTANNQVVGLPINRTAAVLGDLFLVDENGLILDATAANNAVRAMVVQAIGGGKLRIGSVMNKANGSTKYTFEAFQAPVAQVSTYANLGLAANSEYKLTIVIQQDLALIANRQDRIEVSVRTGATVGQADIDKLVANINKQRGSLSVITAAAVGAVGISLTGKAIPTIGIADYEFVRFETTFVTVATFNAVTGRTENLFSQTSINPATVVAVGGKGVAVQIRQLERVALGYQGITDLTHQYYRPLPSYGAVDGVGYGMYNVQQTIQYPGGYLQDSRTQPVSTFVAVPAGAQGTDFGAILTAFMGVSPE